jgi:hypothetical protein
LSLTALYATRRLKKSARAKNDYVFNEIDAARLRRICFE